MKFKRSLRVSELIKREVSMIIAQEVKDPWIKTVSITFVKVADDLKHAKIYFRVLGDDQSRDYAIKGLERANKFFRAEIGHRTDLRFVPELQFVYDAGLEDAYHIDLLLRQITNDSVS